MVERGCEAESINAMTIYFPSMFNEVQACLWLLINRDLAAMADGAVLHGVWKPLYHHGCCGE